MELILFHTLEYLVPPLVQLCELHAYCIDAAHCIVKVEKGLVGCSLK